MVRMLLAAALLAAPAAAQPPAPAAQQQPSPLAWLVGSWRGAGTMMGREVQVTFEVAPVLGGRFLEFRYRAGPFEGRAFYRAAADGGWRAQWFDNRGVSFPIVGRIDGRSLTADWGDAETERGRTVYRLGDDGRLGISDAVRDPDGSSRPFAAYMLTRAN